MSRLMFSHSRPSSGSPFSTPYTVIPPGFLATLPHFRKTQNWLHVALIKNCRPFFNTTLVSAMIQMIQASKCFQAFIIFIFDYCMISFHFVLKSFRKFYRTLFCNRLYPRLLNSSIKLIELFFSV